jgi:hypothetical protein
MTTPLSPSRAIRDPDPRPAPSATSADRLALVAGGLVVSSLATAGLLLVRPGTARNATDHDSVAPVRDGTWLFAVADSLLFGVALVTLAVGTCLLVPDRGRVWATVGAALGVPGALLFSSGVFAFGVLAWYATEPEALSPAAGRSLLEFVEAHPAHLFGPLMVAFFVLNAGLLCITVALWVSRTVPRGLPATLGALVLAQFAIPGGRVTDVVQAALMGTFVVIGWHLWRTHPTTSSERR